MMSRTPEVAASNAASMESSFRGEERRNGPENVDSGQTEIDLAASVSHVR
jgi:hypothetical protein